MKTWSIVLATMVFGLAAGVGTAVVRVRMTGVDTESVLAGGAEAGRYASNSVARPKAVIDETEFDFGTMDDDATQRHAFEFRNEGSEPLTLSKGDTTCRCTLIDLEEKEVPPGGSATVNLEWTSKNQAGPYRQTATIFTNDPDRPRVTLTISGLVTAALKVSPLEVVFSQLSLGESATADVKVLCYLSENFQITGWECEDAEDSDKFEVTHEPLSADQLKAEADAVSGCLVRVTVKPGLLQGAFRQTIRLSTNLEDSASIELPVEGVVRGDISIVGGRNWNGDEMLLTLGTVSSQEGASQSLMLTCRGPRREEVDYRITEVEPEWMEVELGERTGINQGKVLMTPLKIEIPKGSRPANHLGSNQGEYGRITIETNHSTAPQLQILVRFAVEG